MLGHVPPELPARRRRHSSSRLLLGAVLRRRHEVGHLPLELRLALLQLPYPLQELLRVHRRRT